ncbi:uncharacterized protein LOC107303798 [Oryza brachyantha]|uniref:uncharacterized protein LOC107303798 n=1 Tax=Oryza brachyantha TaxID=4533 RepID=UPI001ADC5B2C|nr:uncharacterized protein LOC107303798 [Oryza brachyantha]
MGAFHHHHRHQIKAPKPTWIILKVTPPPRDGAKKLAVAPAPAYSPLLLSPPVWQRAQDAKNSNADGGDPLPASPRIGCMGQVKGRPRRCSGARGGGRLAALGDSAHGGGKRLVEQLTLGLFRRWRGRGRTSSRACSKVRDARSCSSAMCTLDPPLPVVKRPAVNENDNSPTLWERRRGGGAKPLRTLRLT